MLMSRDHLVSCQDDDHTDAHHGDAGDEEDDDNDDEVHDVPQVGGLPRHWVQPHPGLPRCLILQPHVSSLHLGEGVFHLQLFS